MQEPSAKIYQARPAASRPIPATAFGPIDRTVVYWLGAAGVLVNTRGTTIMMDPILGTAPDDPTKSEIGGLPLLAPPPIMADAVPRLDAVLYTHSDGDHMGIATALGLLNSGTHFYTTEQAAGCLRQQGVPADRIHAYQHHSSFYVKNVRVVMTGAFHPHQLGLPLVNHYQYFSLNDCSGFRLETGDGIIWNPGDTMLMEEHLHNTDADLVFMDFSNNEHHFGQKIAVQLANALRWSQLLMFHWGTVYSPEQDCYNADPAVIRPQLIQPQRLQVLAPGEPYVLQARS